MDFTHTTVPVGTDASPVCAMPRNPGERWLVSYAPLHLERAPEWRTVVQGSYTPIPLFPYLTGMALERTVGFACQLAAHASLSVAPRRVQRVHVAVGDTVTAVSLQDGSEALRVWVGIGFLLERS
jgi:hypothetical protein